ncbi:hypothetical protein GQ54DRAFT_115094 [Martensiomyces pterosporus]|nr:hypothetical protein GQ54DRAFT_115094 [Martensiomyces pterosporus]
MSGCLSPPACAWLAAFSFSSVWELRAVEKGPGGRREALPSLAAIGQRASKSLSWVLSNSKQPTAPTASPSPLHLSLPQCYIIFPSSYGPPLCTRLDISCH